MNNSKGQFNKAVMVSRMYQYINIFLVLFVNCWYMLNIHFLTDVAIASHCFSASHTMSALLNSKCKQTILNVKPWYLQLINPLDSTATYVFAGYPNTSHLSTVTLIFTNNLRSSSLVL